MAHPGDPSLPLPSTNEVKVLASELLVRPAARPPEGPEILDAITRREFLAGLAVAGLAAACADQDRREPARSGAPATRTIEHPGGTSQIPVRAERVVSLSEVLAGHLVSVGLVPIGADEDIAAWLEAYQALLAPDLDIGAIASASTAGEPHIEAIAALGPELILAETFFEEFYDRLAGIAPTVLIDRPTNADWKAAFDATVDAAGRQEEAQAVRDRYATARDRLAGQASPVEVAFIRSNGDGTFRIDGTSAFGGSVAADAGLAVTDAPPGVGDRSDGAVDVSDERLDVVTGDVIVLPARRLDLDQVAVFSQNPLWPTLPAVQAERVLALPNPVYNGGTYVAAQLLLEAVAKGTTPSPPS